MVMNKYIYGTFENESQWRGASLSSGRNHTDYICIYVYINQGDHPRPKIRRIESNGMVYLSSSSSLGHDVGPITAKVNVFVPPVHATSRTQPPDTPVPHTGVSHARTVLPRGCTEQKHTATMVHYTRSY